MKILIVNKFLYERGGAEVHAINLGELLRRQGHEVRFYAMRHPRNIPDEADERFFAEEVSFFQSSVTQQVRAALRLFGNGIKQHYTRLLDEFQPDVVHLHNVHSYLAPSVAKLAHERGRKVVWTMHDYKQLCPSYLCLRNGAVCERCFTDKWNVVRHRCMKQSLAASLLAYAEARYWSREKLLRWTDAFICPGSFLADKLRQEGYTPEKLYVVGNFISREKAECFHRIAPERQEQAYAYIGRLSEEKGIEQLLRAAVGLPYKLYVTGSGPMEERLKRQYASENIVFTGHLSAEEVVRLLKQVRFSVMPSVCYENNPLGVIESLCCGTPVLGRRIGGIPELLDTSAYNRAFTGDDELASAIEGMFADAVHVNREQLSVRSNALFSEETYYKQWMYIIKSL
ncbi:MAG: glycosyltransferase [Prevotellaceae bacterium]|jgi:glycosyltransferase involved in cell wall biosynthesis|nr:glycosyltransferase [Prevotellaceae bacterium]